MVQMIQRQPTTSDRFFEAFGKGAEALVGHQLSQQKKKDESALIQQENEASKRLGIDLTGIRDPKMRQEAMAYALQSMNQKSLEEQKLQGKQDLLQGKQDFLNKIFGGANPQQQENQRSNNPQMNTPQQNQNAFNPANISDEDIARVTAMDPPMGRELRAAKDTALREKREERNFKQKEKENSPETMREKELTVSQAKEDSKYYNELQSKMKKNVLKGESLNRIEKIIKKGVSGKPVDQILENIGLISKTSEGRRELAAEVKNQYTDFKDVAGSQLSGMEFQVLSGAYPNANFSQEANEAIVKNLKIVGETLLEEGKIANKLIESNNGKKPENFQARVNEKLFDYISDRKEELKNNLNKIMYDQYKVPEGKILMFINGNTDEPIAVNPDEVERYIGLGAEIP